jgi:hypothetical protein
MNSLLENISNKKKFSSSSSSLIHLENSIEIDLAFKKLYFPIKKSKKKKNKITKHYKLINSHFKQLEHGENKKKKTYKQTNANLK